MTRISKHQAHWHPEAMDEPCAHERPFDGITLPPFGESDYAPTWLVVTVMAVGIVAFAAVVYVLIAFAGPVK